MRRCRSLQQCQICLCRGSEERKREKRIRGEEYREEKEDVGKGRGEGETKRGEEEKGREKDVRRRGEERICE